MAAIRALELERAPGHNELTNAVAQGLFKLMAYKDEYEVARLFTDGSFRKQLERTFTGDYEIEFHLAPPLLSKPDPATGRPAKRRFGRWILPVFKLLAGMRILRATPLDPFGYSAERKEERRLIRDYEAVLDEIANQLTSDTHAVCTELAGLPEAIRGFGPVKATAIAAADTRRGELLDALRAPAPERARAA